MYYYVAPVRLSTSALSWGRRKVSRFGGYLQVQVLAVTCRSGHGVIAYN